MRCSIKQSLFPLLCNISILLDTTFRDQLLWLPGNWWFELVLGARLRETASICVEKRNLLCYNELALLAFWNFFYGRHLIHCCNAPIRLNASYVIRFVFKFSVMFCQEVLEQILPVAKQIPGLMRQCNYFSYCQKSGTFVSIHMI